MSTAPLGEAPETPAQTFAELTEQRRGPLRRFMRSHRTLMDVLLAVTYFLVTAASGLESALNGRWLPWAGVLLIAVLLVVRRRWPMAVLGVVFLIEVGMQLVDPYFSATSIAVWLVLYTTATLYTARRMFTMAALLSAMQLLVQFVVVLPAFQVPEAATRFLVEDTPPAETFVWMMAALTVLSNFSVVGIGAAVRNKRLHEAELANWGSRVQRLAQVAERNRIAREMHDVVAHSLSVMIALSDGARVVLRRDPERAAGVLDELSSTGRSALADMRRVIGVLRDGSNAPLAPQPASSSLSDMLEGFRVAGLPLQITHTGSALPVDAAFQLTVYRIVQESLTNVLRYGRAVTRVHVDLSRDEDTVRIKVTDNGQLLGAKRDAIGSGQGLKGMSERAAIYDGSVYAGPGPRGGWVVHAILTVPEQATEHQPSQGEATR
ncbi:sensor histidine kinase [Arthrobacter rhombi]|uniref:sensor histidine kinase n=1 Tax=Arthrobacter rhombi TaxID=71253 RepID=UPI003FD11F32